MADEKKTPIPNGTPVKVLNPGNDTALTFADGLSGTIQGSYELPWNRGYRYSVRVGAAIYSLAESEFEVVSVEVAS